MKSLFTTSAFFMFVFFFAGFQCPVYGESSASEIVLDETTKKYPLGRHLFLLADPENAWTIDDVTAPPVAGRFVKSRWETPNPGLPDTAIWVRFDLANRTKSNREWILEVPFAPVDRIEMYIPSGDGGVNVLKGGESIPFHEKKPPKYLNPAFHFVLEAEACKTIHMRFFDEGIVPVPLILWASDAFADEQGHRRFVIGIYYGIVLVMVFYNFFLFLTVRDMSYLYYSLYVSAFGVFLMAFNGLAQKYLWPSASVWWSNRLLFFALSIGLALMMQFSKSFLRTDAYAPRINQAFSFLVVLLILEGLGLFAFNFALMSSLIAVTAICCIFMAISGGIACWRKGHSSAAYYILAFITLLTGGLLLSLRYVGLLPGNYFTEHGVQIGSALEITLLSLGLGDRINTERKQKMIAQETAIQAQENYSRMLEQEVRERTEDLESAKEAAEAANRAKSEFLANISHEVRTPMNAIIGFANVLADKIEEPSQRDFLKMIQSSGNELMALLNDLIDLSKLETGRMALRNQPVIIQDTLDRIIKSFTPKFQEKGLAFHCEIDERVPQCLMLDESGIRQILINLIGNALKFTHDGHVAVRLSIDGRTAQDDSSCNIVIEIEDTGIGIPEDQREAIFDVFSQLDGGATRKYGGTGLGLAVSKRLTALMNGEITVESRPGEGSLFRIALLDVAIAPGIDSSFLFRRIPEICSGSVEPGDAGLTETDLDELSQTTYETMRAAGADSYIPELARLLREQFHREWETVKQKFIYDEMEDFAKQLIQEANRYSCPLLENWAETILRMNGACEYNKLAAVLEQFPGIIDRIEKLKA